MSFSCSSCGHFNNLYPPGDDHGIIADIPPRCHKCSIDLQPCGLCQRLAQARQRVQVAKTALDLAVKKEQQLLTEINGSNDRLLSRLPVEVACHVFGFCIPQLFTVADVQDDFYGWNLFRSRHAPKPFQLVLGAVCKTWRCVVWSEPRFWRSIAIILSQTTPIQHITLIEEWLGRSAKRPLIMRIYFKKEWDERLVEEAVARIMQPLVALVNSAIHRCSFFFAQIPSLYLAQLRLQHEQAAPLQCLFLESVINEQDQTQHTRRWDLGVENSPSSVLLDNFQLQNVCLQWSNLTQFTGRCISGPDCVEIFRGAPRLLECTLEGITLADFPPTTDIVLSNITDLHILHSHGGIFNFMTLPSLKTLWCSLSDDTFSEVLTQCISRSACPLEEASFQESSSDDDDLLDFFNFTPALKSLDLAVMEIGDTFLTRLGETCYVPRDKRSTQLLPNLKTFSFNAIRTFSWSAVAAMAPTQPPQPGMVRRPLQDICFSIVTYHDDVDVTSDLWPEFWEQLIGEEDLDKMLSMIDGGVKLAIYDEDGRHDIIEVSKDYHRPSESSDDDAELGGNSEI